MMKFGIILYISSESVAIVELVKYSIEAAPVGQFTSKTIQYLFMSRY